MKLATWQAEVHDDFIALLERIRGKYKQVCSGLPLGPDAVRVAPFSAGANGGAGAVARIGPAAGVSLSF